MKRISLLLVLVLAGTVLTTQAFASTNLAANVQSSGPAFPLAIRVGWVTAYTPGASITIEGQDGSLFTFSLTNNIKILPMKRSSQLAVGSRVTILAKRVPSTGGWMAFGIVVHPAGSGAGSMPPTLTPTAVPTATTAPSETPTETLVPTEVPTDTVTATP